MSRDARLNLSAAIALIAAGLALSAALTSCAPRAAAVRPDPAVVEAHTAGMVSRNDAIDVVFVRPMRPGDGTPEGLVAIDPPVKGELSWLDDRSLEFKPASPLKVGRSYRVTVDYGILEGKERGKAVFGFDLGVSEPVFGLALDPVSVDDSGRIELSGCITTDPGESDRAAEALLRLPDAYKGLPLSWKHEGGSHRFSLSGIKQGKRDSAVTVTWNGRVLGSGLKGKAKAVLPGSKAFGLLGALPAGIGEDYVELSFSRPLDRDQDLRGIVSVDGVDDLRYSIDRNKLRVYSASYGLPSQASVRVLPGLRDSSGERLAVPVAASVKAASQLPKVRFLGSGVIVPTSQGYTVPIETMNLRGVIVEAYKIHGANVQQFLQVNDLDGTKELYRVGKAVWNKSFDLNYGSDQRDTWVRHGLDLSELVKKNPDGMFQVRVTFRPRHIDYECTKGHPDFSSLKFPGDAVEDERSGDESSYWDYWEGGNGYSYDSPYNYYRNREDPCHPAFYMRSYGGERSVARRNVLVSNIGLMAKRDSSAAIKVYAADLRTTKPLAGMPVSLIDFQKQTLASARTDKNGMAVFSEYPGAPYLVAAENAGQFGYLKLDEKSSLKTSHFDVDGDKSEQGVKGFIYGERGVWRPGDPIYLTFILQDPDDVIPESHPVLFQLESPLGQVTQRATYVKGLNGFYAIQARTSPDAPTGDWIARVSVGNKTYTKGLKVETVMPNRLKINLDYGTKGYLSADPQRISLSSAWLHGAPAPGFKADVSATFSAASTTFPGYSDYVFDDPTRSVSPERQTLFEGVLDRNSKASFEVEMSPGDAPPGKLKANLLSRVYEPSGVFSSEQVSIDFHPYSRYVGIKPPKGDQARGMLLTDTDHVLEVAVLDRDGKPAQGGEIECSLSKIQWRWWWEKGAENLAEYQNSDYFKQLQRGSVQVRNGKAQWSFKVKYPDWGRYILIARDKAGGHSTAKIVYIDWPGWAGRGDKDSGSASMLSLTVGKPSYTIGEKASVTFPSNANGSALVVIEKGGKILKEEWVQTAKDTTRYDFSVGPHMAPNVYVHVTFLQPHLQTANDLPIRLYGITPVMVEDPQTHLKPVIIAPAQLKPESEAAFSVKEEAGRAMTYTVAVVDEGLLGLTRFKAPDPWNVFYRKEASFLKNWDLYQFVSGAFSGKLETLLSVGGSDDGLSGADRKANRFQPVTMYLGPFSLAKGETKSHKIKLPAYVGAVRFMVVAGSGRAYGTAEKEVPVKSDLMVLGTLPRVLSPGEEISLPVTVFSYLNGKNDVRVEVRAEGAASISGPSQATLGFPAPGDKIASFKVKAADRPGLAKFTVAAKVGSANAIQSFELDVRSTGVPVSDFDSGVLDGKSKKALTLELSKLPGMPGTNSLTLELSRLPPLNLQSRLDWLIAYPHGCIEQTTSSVFPQLYLPKVVKLDEAKRAEVAKNVSDGIERIKLFQTADGGFAYWPGNEDSNAWGSNYAGHFLLEAKRAGYAVPELLLSDWLAFQKRRAQSFSGDSEESLQTQAYRLYTLALAKEADRAAMNRLREGSKLPLNAAWRLAAAYYMAGERAAAQEMTRSLGVKPSSYRELSGTFGSDTRDLAMILETLNIMGDTARSGQVMKTLAEIVGSNKWLSTQELSYALIAILPFASEGGRSALPFSYQLALGKAGYGEKVRGTLDASVAQVALKPGDAASAKIQVSIDAPEVLYARLLSRGIPAMGDERAVASGVDVSVEYADISGEYLSPDSLPLGSDMEIQVFVQNNYHADLKEMALSHLLPSGWEIINYRIAIQQEEGEGSDGEYGDRPPARSSAYPFMNHQDIRDDRVYTYFNLAKGESKTFVIRVNKTYEGRFYLPAVQVQAMYDDSIQAVAPGRWLGDSGK